MNPACEIVVQHILPVIRANIAKELVSQGLTQKETASVLNLTQPAVSQYVSKTRGKQPFQIKDKKLNTMVGRFATRLRGNSLSDSDKNAEFCKICSYCRETALICKFHENAKTGCKICLGKLNCD